MHDYGLLSWGGIWESNRISSDSVVERVIAFNTDRPLVPARIGLQHVL
jgi:hypothetical protein